MSNMINLTIDGIETQVPAGSTILQAAEQVGVHIPTLCYLDLHEIGIENKPASCRVCVVEVVGPPESGASLRNAGCGRNGG